MSAKSRFWGTQEQAIASMRCTVYRYKALPLVIATGPTGGDHGGHKFAAWLGKAATPFMYYYLRPEDAPRLDALRQYAERQAEAKVRRAAAIAKARKGGRAADYWQVGDVIYNSWGYDQTNIDFYEVVEVLRASIRIRPIAQNSNDRGGPSGGKCSPRRGEYCGAARIKKVDRCGRISMEHGAASKWDGRALGCSSYH